MTRESNHSRISSLLSVSTFRPGRSSSPGGPVSAGGDDERTRDRARGLRAKSRSRSREPRPISRSSTSPPGTAPRGLRNSRSSTGLNAGSGPDQQSTRLSTLAAERDLPPLPGMPDAGFAPGQMFGGMPDLGSPLQPPPPIAGFGERPSSSGGSRSGSRHRPESSVGSIDSRPMSRVGTMGPDFCDPAALGKLSKRNWAPGARGAHSRAASETSTVHLAQGYAFVVTPDNRIPYDTAALVGEKQVPELWNEQGDLMVHLYDKATSQGPSFRLRTDAVSDSRNFTGQPSRHGSSELRSHMRNLSMGTGNSPPNGSGPGSQAMSRSSSAMSDEEEYPPQTPYLDEQPDGLHLYLQLQVSRNATGSVSTDGLERLVRIRNLFAFLVGQVLIGTPATPSLFAIFLSVSSMLKQYEFTNSDRSSHGDIPLASFLGYVEDLQLSDVRTSREKTLEAIVLGERMKCWPLYNEGFVHAVGKYGEVMNLKTPVQAYVSETTRQRLEKSALALDQRLKTMKGRLESFEFPSLFAGVLASSAASKSVDVRAWKAGFVAMRKHTIGVYRQRHGSWPPKAKSKKNDFEGSGLNRVVAQEMYADLSDLYDLLVDRRSLTTRSVDGHDVAAGDHENPAVLHLRKFMSEFDRSSPPVLPPIPYDIPLMPQMVAVRRDFGALNVRKQVKERSRKGSDNEINSALMASYNRDAVKATPFLTSFMAFERANAHGKTFDDIIDARVGQWIFLYVVIQCLPLLAIDAPDLRWTQAVEYFLCEVPKGSPPWVRDDPATKRYYSVAGGQGLVSLPADVVEHGVEGTYLRSHCWQVASDWNAARAGGPDSPAYRTHSPAGYSPGGAGSFSATPPLAPPPAIGSAGGAGSRPGSAQGFRSSVAMGLDPLQAPPPLVDPEHHGHVRRISTPDPARNFDAILASSPQPSKKKR